MVAVALVLVGLLAYPFGSRRLFDVIRLLLDAIPAEVVLAPDGPAGTSETQDDSDFAARLKALSAEQEKQP